MELDDRLDDVFRQHREDLDADVVGDPEMVTFIDDVARELASAAGDLSTRGVSQHDAEDWRSLRQLLTDPDTAPAVAPYVEVRLAEALTLSSREMYERFRSVLDHLVASEVGSGVRQYLKLVSRCFLSRYDQECIVLCRAVLEAALKDACQRMVAVDPSYSPRDNLEQMIKDARSRGWLSESLARDAHDVRHRGNTALHKDPTVVQHVHDTLAKTLSIVDGLSRADIA